MLYALLKGYARLALPIYCRQIHINRPEWLQAKGPLLLAANHPNSFLDGIITTTLFRHRVYSLARGDAFKNKRAERILRWLNLLPVYRTSEGPENLAHNYTTFASCHEAFAKNDIVLIFSEGQCINEWHLRPLRKGTARLALSSWQKGIDLTVVPVGFNYNMFGLFGKNVHIHFGQPLDRRSILEEETEGKQLLQFNRQLEGALKELVYEIDPKDKAELRRRMQVPQPFWKRLLLLLPAGAGWLLHAPLYYPVRAWAARKFPNDHYDSVVVAVLLLLYPLYLLLGTAATYFLWGGMGAAAAFTGMPFCAWSCVQLNDQIGS